MATLPEWLQWTQALTPPIVSAVVIFVAWRQWVTARQKLVLDLFDRRLEVFRRLREAVNAIADGSGDVNQHYRAILDAKIESQFLFGEDIVKRIVAIDKLAWNQKVLLGMRSDVAVDPETRLQLIHEAALNAGRDVLQMVDLTGELGVALRGYLSMRTRVWNWPL